MPQRRSLALAIGLAALALCAPAAQASFHFMKIVEVFPGTQASPNAQYVVLQMYAGGQNLVAGHTIRVYNAAGTQIASFTFAADVPSGANQAKILIATTEAVSFFNVSSNLPMTPVIPLAGGKVCFDASIDCVAWGNYTGSSTGVGTPFNQTGGGLRQGRAIRRKLGTNGTLEAADDTGVSANDFEFATTPAPRNNAGTNGTIPASVCGNSALTGLEACDDGNTTSGDGCRADCRGTELCGDQLIDVNETCDDGNTAGGDSCPASCSTAVCGNGSVEAGESCDDGNTNDLDACGNDCTSNFCGDGQVNNGEPCDDGNAMPGDGCRADCTAEVCGDGIVDPGEDCDDGPGEGRRYRVSLSASANGFARSERVVETPLDLQARLAQAGGSGTVDLSSLKLVEVSAGGGSIDTAVPFQFDGPASNGTLVWPLEGATASGATRRYHLYFDTTAFPPPVFPDQVVVTDGIVDAGQLSYRVVTPGASWFYQKEGAAFSSLIDANGNDWIGYSTAAGTSGEYRGIPNLFGSPVTYHPGATTASSSLVTDGPLKATIASPSDDGQQNLRWDFYPTRATMTMLQATGSYWFLYEGTPGGLLERNGNDVVVRSNGAETSAATSWNGDLAGDEWSYFADKALERSLFVAHHTGDASEDSYFPYDDVAGGPDSDWMTVFGFGRQGATALLSGAPRLFTVGLVGSDVLGTVRAAILSAHKDVPIAVGTAEAGTGPTDECREDCTLAACRDGILDAGEQCDDGNESDLDACGNDCLVNFCGDGQTNNAEECDDANADDLDACGNDCLDNFCGDAEANDGEECDDGNLEDADACGNDCVANFCGDGQVNDGEVCDDGNTVGGDGCPADCAAIPGIEEASALDLRVERGDGSAVSVTFAPACGATDHAVYWGYGPIAGALVWLDSACGLGTDGSASFDPGAPAPGELLYFVVVGYHDDAEGSYGRSSGDAERSESVGIGACDRPRTTGTCSRGRR